ncbi:hypothetical protein [Pantoea sp.]|uniref:hypothetical protein n=1 Tax=Pantoea sp. TaxID=69393 RepID=UPI0031DD7365
MKKAIILAAVSLILSGCDNSSTSQVEKIDDAKPKQESAKFNCINGNVSIECEIQAGDQLGSGKWRHAKLNISGSDASLNIDGELFVKTDVSSAFIDGSRVVTFELMSAKKSRAEVDLESSNSSTSLRVRAWNSAGKLMLISSR